MLKEMALENVPAIGGEIVVCPDVSGHFPLFRGVYLGNYTFLILLFESGRDGASRRVAQWCSTELFP